MCCQILFANILFRIFHQYSYARLVCSFILCFLSGLKINVRVASQKEFRSLPPFPMLPSNERTQKEPVLQRFEGVHPQNHLNRGLFGRTVFFSTKYYFLSIMFIIFSSGYEVIIHIAKTCHAVLTLPNLIFSLWNKGEIKIFISLFHIQVKRPK